MNIENLSLDENLKPVVNELSGFLEPESITALSEFCGSFPIITSQDIGIEIKLLPVDYKADIAFSIEKNSAGCTALLNESIKRDSEGIAGWHVVKEVLKMWNSNRRINETIKRLWLEFDSNDSGYNPVPSLFIEFEEGITAKNHNNYSSFIVRDLSYLSNLLNITVDIPHGKMLCKYLLNFNFTSPLYEIGAMLSRSNSGLRIVFADFGIASINTLLENLGYTGNINKAVQLYNDVKRMFDYLILHINWQNNTDYFAIECYFNNKNTIDKEPRWLEVISYIDKLGIAKETFAAMLNYPGTINTHSSYPFTIIKRFNHIKFIIKNDSDTGVKAYLGIRADYKF